MARTDNPAPLDDSDIGELAYLLHEFITAPTFMAKQRLVEGNQRLLLSSEADSALAALLLEYDDHSQMRESLALHRTLLEKCRSLGVREAFVQARQRIGERGNLDDLTEEEVQTLVFNIGEFITTEDWSAAREYLRGHPELLSLEADGVFERLIESHARRNEHNVVRQLVVHRDLLRAARELGEDAAFGRVFDPPDALDIIADNTVTVLTTRDEERENWLRTVQMARIRAAELGDEQTRRLLEAVSRLLLGEEPASIDLDLEGEQARAWERIIAALDRPKEA